MTQEYEGIIFDMDGVLVDSEGFYYQRRKAFLKEYDLSIEQIPIPSFIGADMRSLWETIFEVNDTIYDEAFLSEKYHQYKKEHPIDYANLIDPDAKRVLQFFKRKGYKIGLASSSTLEVIQEVLKVGQLTSYFDVVVSGTKFEKSKPNPEIYKYTAQEMGIEPHNCLAIEDSEKGIRAAHDAGTVVWALKDTRFGMDQQLADLQLDTLSDMCKKLQNIEQVG
ncbi:HAD hydrolase, family IA [Enterococcus haemoperoxidus ATCC BAA-382]|uniref:HAD hydrolase, family IA n=1 Tax=Enterococcus haemoperoxidus ATCC BAA-382 TaxID=1158608 RepID=R2QUT4_9ENTE|nr:HAD family phosphatase [Enterococcus haemoperoxidus]EOI00275.1 HAD hydrolase, family IA [Enterococcus haemoperoxidus ATCC BAA-382]EOT59635.1 HAD superfamily hydrolase [Enterococcus haemoperoxidus ATCC BAA-382]OJG53112.1 HAD hydrolase, family IA [Enterococcus haemoperoxidus]